MFVGHVNQLDVSRSKEIRLEICICLHIYNRICFELSMFYGQPEYVYMSLVFMFYSVPRQNFGSTSLLFSEYTISLPGRVFGEQRGGAVEILSRIGVEHEN